MPEITAKITQILSNLILETAVNDRLELTPELDLLANTQFATSADTELVRIASLHASVVFLSALDLAQQAQVLSVMYPMLNTVPSLPHARLPLFLLVVTELAASNPHLFCPHILAHRLPPLAAPTSCRSSQGENGDDKAVSGEDNEVHKGALEFMTTLSEARPNMLRGIEGWVNIVVCGCLEGTGEIPEDNLDKWLEANGSTRREKTQGMRSSLPHATWRRL
ncbi:uncharacterized protein TRAVEDRAFT_41117 [Trametes versicolor FP-101664 SS1]|uniref:uncharacterized protein n=1 Tax=Trametes versicolor (strain FP-101664) TaxID=717944 RepID=UPI000462277B|nr:uncharacterized protein TRAVEDRAFT_41117 [Trametes versicolor FP-101664 SS1]EIW63688.1 hypothetical protein TRAVEDRAFT_41117 [Trametes versicolor FP-101664 SS1]